MSQDQIFLLFLEREGLARGLFCFWLNGGYRVNYFPRIYKAKKNDDIAARVVDGGERAMFNIQRDWKTKLNKNPSPLTRQRERHLPPKPR